MKRFLVVLLLCFSLAESYSQPEIKRTEWFDNWVIGGSAGVSYLAMELNKDFSKASMDMNSLPDAAYSFHLYKRKSQHFDMGVIFYKCNFSGFKQNSSQLYWLTHNNRFKGFEPHAISYKTDFAMFAADFKYNFLQIYSIKYNFLNANFYLRGSLGLATIGVEMGYQNDEHYALTGLKKPLYEKGQGSQPERTAYGAFATGFGITQQFSSRWSFFSEISLIIVSNDYLDGVQNFQLITNSDNSQTLKRIGVYDTVGILRFGLSYHFSIYKLNKADRKSKYPWSFKDEKFRNEFYIDKRHNRFKDAVQPFHNPKMERKTKVRSVKIE